MSENLQILLLAGHILLGICLISIILIQKSKGSDMGAAFGGGASDTVFGARGSATFLSRTTAILATLFFISSMALAYVYKSGGPAGGGDSVFDRVDTEELEIAPVEAPEFDGLDVAPAVTDEIEPADTVTEESEDASETTDPGA